MPSAGLALTTVDRVIQYLDIKPEDIRTGGNLVLQGMVASVSQSISNLCNSDFGVRARVERRQLAQPMFKLSYGPVRSISSIRYSVSRILTTGYVQLTTNGYEVDPDGDTVYVDPSFVIGKWWEVRYTGGRYYSTNTSKYNATASGAVTPGTYAQTDGRSISIISFSSNVLTFSSLGGSFREGDSIAAGATMITLGTVLEESVCNDAPDLEEAAKMQISYLWQRHKSLGRTSTDLGNGASQFVKDYDLLPGVRTLLTRFARPYTFM